VPTEGKSRQTDLVQSEERLYIRQYDGPFPPASELLQIKQVDPAYPERIMKLTEDRTAANIRQQDRESIAPLISMGITTLFGLCGFGLAALFGLKGMQGGTIASIVGGIAPIIIAALANLRKK
jgi:uncharacterized membrane protein